MPAPVSFKAFAVEERNGRPWNTHTAVGQTREELEAAIAAHEHAALWWDRREVRVMRDGSKLLEPVKTDRWGPARESGR